MMSNKISNYGNALREGCAYLLSHHPEVFVLGQGLWAPWYVGNSMKELEKEFGKDRVIDTPVSEGACTGLAVGASLHGYRPIVLHPRVDFMILAVDQIVSQAAKWSHMFGGQKSAAVTIRGIVNRGGEQGAQHSQALHAWFSHIPGLRVVMPASVQDAQDLLIASVLCDDPVVFIDDRWLYDIEATLTPPSPVKLESIAPKIIQEGTDITLVGASFSNLLCINAAKNLNSRGISAEVIDLRVINPLDRSVIIKSVKKTGRLVVVDGGWQTCGLAGEVLASVFEKVPVNTLRATPKRITIPDAPAPTSRFLEDQYYPDTDIIIKTCVALCKNDYLSCA